MLHLLKHLSGCSNPLDVQICGQSRVYDAPKLDASSDSYIVVYPTKTLYNQTLAWYLMLLISDPQRHPVNFTQIEPEPSSSNVRVATR